MMRVLSITLSLLCFAAFMPNGSANAKERTDRATAPAALTKTATSGDSKYMDVNRISTPIRNNGSFNRDPGSGNAGFEWPKGTGNTANYASGLWLGGKRGGVVRVAVAEYAYEYDAGPIAPGVDPADARWRVYSIKRGDDAATNVDYANWPWQDGAPVVKATDGTDSLDGSGERIPELIGDQTIWCVFNDNDVTKHTNMNTLPLGIEVQLTAFAFNRGDALGDNIFYKWKFINKSGETIDSAFVTVWTDVDLGDSGDDLDGCDTTRGIGYTYNDGIDGVYGAQTPATGFDFLQGPMVPGAPTDTARFPDGRVVPGHRLLKMTSFIKYNNDTSPLGNPNTGDEVFNYMKGVDRNGASILDNNGNPTAFMFPGDPNLPLSSSNWIEAAGTGGDRRFMMTAGPFTFANGEEQEIVAANLIAFGATPTQSVTALQNADAAIQTAYDLNFKLSDPPPAPIVSASTSDKNILLSWGDGAAAATRAISIEKNHVLDPLAQAANAANFYYDFEGYVVYQYSDAFGNNPKIVATYDRTDNPDGGPSPGIIFDDVFDANLGQTVHVPVKFGSNAGVKRDIVIDKDYYTNLPLSNAKDYYFAVTAYSYNLESVPKTLESAPAILTVRPAMLLGGVQPRSTRGDTISAVSRTSGPSDGFVQAFVTDPSKVTGHTYTVSFSLDQATSQIVWNVDDATTGTRKLSNQVNQTGDAAYPTVDGIQIKVFGAPNNFKNFLTVSNGAGALDPPEAGAFGFNGSGFPLIAPLPDGTDRPLGTRQQTAGLTASSGWGIHTGMNDPGMDVGYEFFVSRVTQGGARWSKIIPYDFEIRFTAAGSMALFPADFGSAADKLVHVPFELWNIGINTPGDPSDDYQLFTNILDVDGSNTFNLLSQAGVDSIDNGGGGADHGISGGANDPFTDWFYWVAPSNKAPGHAGYDAIVSQVTADIAAGNDPYLGAGTDGDVIRRMVLVGWNFGDVANAGAYLQQMPEVGTVFRIIGTKPNQPGADIFSVNTAGLQPSVNASLAATDVNLINVVPNPYYGASAYERNQLAHIMRFTNLPPASKIRIFSLAGVLVRTLENTGTGTSVDWDVENKDGLPVASGMYIAYVEVPNLGSKILKLAVIQSEERLDNF